MFLQIFQSLCIEGWLVCVKQITTAQLCNILSYSRNNKDTLYFAIRELHTVSPHIKTFLFEQMLTKGNTLSQLLCTSCDPDLTTLLLAAPLYGEFVRMTVYLCISRYDCLRMQYSASAESPDTENGEKCRKKKTGKKEVPAA